MYIVDHMIMPGTWKLNADVILACLCLSVQSGEITCQKKACDCTKSRKRTACCPPCRKRNRCRHQSLPISFASGDFWMYKCDVCVCRVSLVSILHGDTSFNPVVLIILTCHLPSNSSNQCHAFVKTTAISVYIKKLTAKVDQINNCYVVYVYRRHVLFTWLNT